MLPWYKDASMVATVTNGTFCAINMTCQKSVKCIKSVCVPEEHYLTKGLTVVWVYLGDMLVRWLYHTVEIMNHNISLKGNNV